MSQQLFRCQNVIDSKVMVAVFLEPGMVCPVNKHLQHPSPSFTRPPKSTHSVTAHLCGFVSQSESDGSQSSQLGNAVVWTCTFHLGYSIRQNSAWDLIWSRVAWANHPIGQALHGLTIRPGTTSRPGTPLRIYLQGCRICSTVRGSQAGDRLGRCAWD